MATSEDYRGFLKAVEDGLKDPEVRAQMSDEQLRAAIKLVGSDPNDPFAPKPEPKVKVRVYWSLRGRVVMEVPASALVDGLGSPAAHLAIVDAVANLPQDEMFEDSDGYEYDDLEVLEEEKAHA